MINPEMRTFVSTTTRSFLSCLIHFLTDLFNFFCYIFIYFIWIHIFISFPHWLKQTPIKFSTFELLILSEEIHTHNSHFRLILSDHHDWLLAFLYSLYYFPIV